MVMNEGRLLKLADVLDRTPHDLCPSDAPQRRDIVSVARTLWNDWHHVGGEDEAATPYEQMLAEDKDLAMNPEDIRARAVEMACREERDTFGYRPDQYHLANTLGYMAHPDSRYAEGEQHFSMQTWITTTGQGLACDTVACIAGMACLVFKDDVDALPETYEPTPAGVWEAAKDLLGLDEGTADRLFMAQEASCALSSITSPDAAEACRRLASGRPDIWGHLALVDNEDDAGE